MKLTQATSIHIADIGAPHAISMKDSVKALKTAGFHYIDASVNTMTREDHLPLCLDSWESFAHEMRDFGDESGVEFIQSHAFFPVNGPVDLRGWDYENEMIRRSIVSSAIMGVKYIVVHPKRIPEHTPRQAFDFNYEYFCKWGEFADKHGIGIAMENLPPHKGAYRFSVDYNEVLELAKKINSPNVGMCLDTGHANMAGFDNAKIIRDAGKWLRATHIQDNFGTRDDHLAPLMGNIKWNDVMKALHDIDYQHGFTFEIQSISIKMPASIQQDLINFSYKLGEYLLTLAK